MQRGEVITNEVYHIYNRGVDKRRVYMDNSDYSYFIHLLYSFNDSKNSFNTKRSFLSPISHDRGSTSIMKREKRDLYADIYAFVLMPNHFHLLLRQRVDHGISKFMQKIGTGYTLYFNEKYGRTGSLFQGRYKSVHIAYNNQMYYIPHYIHLNPMSLPEAKKSPLVFLKKYKWSSLPDYLGNKNFSSVTQREHILSLFGTSDHYLKDLTQYTRNKAKFANFDTSDFIDFNHSQ